MNNDIFKKLKELKKTDIIDRNWLESFRQTLRAHIRANPITKITEIKKHPLTPSGLVKVFSPLGWKLIPVILTAIILLISGLSIAANSTLPGNVLYGWKININERVQAFSKLSLENRADYEIGLVGERLKEITELSAKGVMDAQTSAETITNLKSQIQRAEKQISQLETEDTNKALEATIKFKAVLNAYQGILKQIEENAGNDLKEQIRTTIETTEQTTAKLDDKNSDLVEKAQDILINSPEQDQKTSLELILNQTNERLILTTQKVESAPSDNELIQKAQEQLRAADELFSKTKIDFENGNYQMVLENIQKIISYLSNAETLLIVDENTNEDVKEIIDKVPEPEIPVIISIQPSFGPINTEITLTGEGFVLGETYVVFSNIRISRIINEIEWINAETIKFIVPGINSSDAEEFDVKAVNKDRESNAVSFIITNTGSNTSSTTPSSTQTER